MPPARARTTLAALHPAFRYQPQFDLQSGRLAGAESMLFFAESGTLLAATLATIEEFEFAGLGMSLFERWLREACTERRFWLRQTGGEFPVAVPVSAANLVDPAFLPLEEVVARSDLLIVGAPHREYRGLKHSGEKPVVDIWNIYGKGTALK